MPDVLQTVRKVCLDAAVKLSSPNTATAAVVRRYFGNAASTEPAPLLMDGVRYVAVPWGKARGLGQNGGIIAAHNPASGAELWTLEVYHIDCDDEREGDKQDVFIESMHAAGGALRVVSERGDGYLVDVARRTVAPHGA